MSAQDEEKKAALRQKLQQQTEALRASRETQRGGLNPPAAAATAAQAPSIDSAGTQQTLGQQTEQLRQARTDLRDSRVRGVGAADTPSAPALSSSNPVNQGAEVTPGRGLLGRAQDLTTGAIKVNAGLALAPVAAGLDLGRQALASATDSTLTSEQKTYFADKIGGGLMARGADDLSRGVDGAKAAVTNMIGATPSTPSAPKSSAGPAPAAAVQAGADSQAQGASAVAASGNGYEMRGNNIAGRRGLSGVMEFTNNQNAVSGAEDKRAPGSAATEQPVAVGQPGDAAKAIKNFDEANRIRGEMIRSQGGLRVAGTGGDAFGAVDRAQARREQHIGAGHGLITPSTQRTLIEDLSKRDQSRVASDHLRRQQQNEANAIAQEQSRLNQEQEQAGRQDQLRQAREKQISDLQAAMVDQSSTPEKREEARRSYAALTTEAKDRYVSQDAIIGVDEMGNPKYGKQVIDTVTGQPVSAQAEGGQKRQPLAGEEVDGYRFKGGNPADQNNWEKV